MFTNCVGRIGVCFAVITALAVAAAAQAAKPALLRTPNGGIQPQALMDGTGNLHLIYFKGDAAAGDIFYVRREAGKDAFSEPIRVNSQPGSAVAMGTIRGGQFCLGKDDRVHVVWNGSKKASPKAPNDSHPMLYARMNDGKAFEPQRNLMQASFNLDGGGSVAADREGNIYVSWHGLGVGVANGEGNRQVFLARSGDDGKTFTHESPVNPVPTGTCGCCGMKALTDSKGATHLLYRSASENTNRDMYLLTSKDKGKSFQHAVVQKWSINSCPMSSETLVEGLAGVLAGWETEGQVYFARITPGSGGLSKPISPGAGRGRKHPALASNSQGETILVWTEGTGWQKGGSLNWRIFDKADRPTEETGRVASGIPVWGLPTVVTTADGSFLIIH